MAYVVEHGFDIFVMSQSLETATDALELFKELEEEKQLNIKVSDPAGAILTVHDLAKLSSSENI
jgi:hypothetical protein